MSGRRIKLLVILVGVVLAALALAAWTQTWFTVDIREAQPVTIDGSVAAPALTALALSELVLLLAIAIAGPFFRIVLGVIEALVGVAITWSSIVAVSDPVAASASAISKATGVAGHDSITHLASGGVITSAWPWLAIVAGVLIVVMGIVTLVTARLWPNSTSRKYTRVAPVASERTSVDDWDSLSGGDDPTT